ncbi:peptide MFS transporter [Phaeodactylibacter sp.]|uniref:peptide MFS transporter n=1 Tax=Phaeodactylibacter sp. TaxID=1940289 RepID=UPI0025D1F109|nr:peptide MFS transporter [Phaeodactylibacter sp.]MCI4646673.1 peptide MFS transporter [Phaeodactylibacter sp.]MCI5093698.1 peptide MFS transporter [Phaeodactylibacter sp.]
MSNGSLNSLTKHGTVLGHPSGLFVLFFTEMWERFSYYGMRALLVIFLIGAIDVENPGWGWEREDALSLLGTYALMVYLTPIMGGYIADRMIGYRSAVVIGALLMTLGHASMAVETPLFLYIGIGFLIFGNGFFKPNMTSIISKMYENFPEKKDGAYTIFYMGVNAGAFLGIMLCGYLGEKVAWSFGFGLAGIFMFLGMLQFYFAKPIFDGIGDKPESTTDEELEIPEGDKLNPFTLLDKILIGAFVVLSVIWIFNDPLSKIGEIPILPGGAEGTVANSVILTALVAFLVLLISRLTRYTPLVRDKMIAVAIFAFFTVFFWASFEQAAGSMAIFAKDYTSRALAGNTAMIFKVVDTIITIIPLAIITWVLYSLFRMTYKKITLSNIILGLSFVIIWGIVIYKLMREFSNTGTEVPATWFAILNSLFIIMFAPLFSRWWESKYNPSAAVKYGIGLSLLGVGFGFLVFGSLSIPQGAETAAVSMIWLILAYLFHTLGELCLSPVGLSYLSKLVPGRMIAFMFGIWYLAIAIGNKLAHFMGGKIDAIVSQYSLSTFFLIFTIVPIASGLLVMALNPLLKRLMHGVR